MTKRSEKPHRPRITKKENEGTIEMVETALSMRLREKGCGAWVSSHEILGVLTEEYQEVTDAVHSGTVLEIRHELIDIAVACVFGISCIDAEALDW